MTYPVPTTDHPFTKRQTVYYTPWGNKMVIRARVETVHRDGTLTVRALFIQQDGKDAPGYLGYKYRLGPESLRTAP